MKTKRDRIADRNESGSKTLRRAVRRTECSDIKYNLYR